MTLKAPEDAVGTGVRCRCYSVAEQCFQGTYVREPMNICSFFSAYFPNKKNTGIVWRFQYFFLPFTLGEDTFARKKQKKGHFICFFAHLFVSLPSEWKGSASAEEA